MTQPKPTLTAIETKLAYLKQYLGAQIISIVPPEREEEWEVVAYDSDKDKDVTRAGRTLEEALDNMIICLGGH